MREEHEKAVNLPEDNADAFAVIVEWLYAKSILGGCDSLIYVTAYIDADKYCMPELQNALMDTLCPGMWGPAVPSFVTLVWKYTFEGSKLREFALDYLHYCLVMKPELYKPAGAQYYEDFSIVHAS